MAHILIVESEMPQAEAAAQACRNEGHTATVVRHATEAMLYLTQRPYDLVMVEAFMPGKEGISLIQGLRAQPALKRLPIVALAPHPEAQERLVAMGADRVLGLPVDLSEVCKTIATMAERTP